MSVTIKWKYDPNVPITEFDLDKSTDKALSYTNLATIPFNLNGANYDRKEKLFFYNDPAGNPGDIYKIVVNGVNGASKPAFIIAPPTTGATCTIFGYIQDAMGRVDTSIKVFVENYGKPGEKWVKNPTGLVAQHNEALGIVDGGDVVFPNEHGIWQVELLQDTYARIRISELDFDWVFEVPDKTGPVNIRDIKQLRGASFHGLWPEQSGIPEKITSG